VFPFERLGVGDMSYHLPDNFGENTPSTV